MQIRTLAPMLLSLALLQGACKKKETPAPPVTKEVVGPETPVPAPEGILVEGIVRAPDAILESMRTVSPLVPDKAGPLLANVMHIPAAAGSEIDGSKPLYLVVAKLGPETAFIVAAPIKDAAKVTDVLAKTPSLKRSDDAEGQLAIFESLSTPRNQVLAVRRSYLLAGASVATIKALAPYATRTMPTKPVPTEEVALTMPQAAIRGTIRDSLKAMLDASALQRKQMLEQAKTTGAPPGALDVVSDYQSKQTQRFVEWLADAGDGRVVLTTSGGAIALRAEVAVPNAESAFGKQVASWPLGGAVDALDVPPSSFIAFSSRTSETSRTEASRDVADMLASSFSADIGPKEKTLIEGFLATWDKARGEKTTGSLVYEGPTKVGLTLRLEAKDAPALSKMMGDALKSILAVKGVASGLKKQGIDAPKFTTEKVSGIDTTVMTIKLPRKPGEIPKPGEPDDADVVFGPSGSDVVVAAGVGARDILKEMIDAKTDPTKSFASSTSLAAQMKALGETTAGVGLVLPSRIIPMSSGATVTTTPPPNDPILIAIGKGTSGPYVSLALSKPAVDTLVRLLMKSMLTGGPGGGMGGGGMGGMPPGMMAPPKPQGF
jgi:hypothetical protein